MTPQPSEQARPWNETNPDWWKAQIEDRGDIAWQWLVNEWVEAVAPDPVASPAEAGWTGSDLDDLENFAGSGYCPGCKVAIDLHPWRVDDPDAIRCPTPREALDALYARLGQPVAEEPA